jgi:hypothetical protein
MNASAMEFLRQKKTQQAVEMLRRGEAQLMALQSQLETVKSPPANINKSSDDGTAEAPPRDSRGESLKNKLFGLTYNNFGCIYKQNNDLSAALESLKRALYYESLEEISFTSPNRPHLLA